MYVIISGVECVTFTGEERDWMEGDGEREGNLRKDGRLSLLYLPFLLEPTV